MPLNLALALATLLVLVTAGASIGRRVLPLAHLETRVMVGAGLAILYSGAAVALAIFIPGTERLWMALVAIPIIIAAAVGLAEWKSLIRSYALGASTLLVVVASVMMAAPYHPAGEFDPGTVYATRIPGRPADNRLPYRTVQFVMHEIDPDDRYFIDWAVTDRTQLGVGIPTMAVALAGVEVPADEIWYRPVEQVGFLSVDPFGYWVVRNALIAMNGLLPLGIAALAAPWLGTRVAAGASIAAALSVFALAETAFTWPKFVAVAVACASGGAFLRTRPIIGGALAGAAYLLHPVGGLLIPAVLWLAWRRGDLRGRAVVSAMAAAVVVVVPWMLWVSVVEGTSSRMTLYPIGWVLTSGDAMSKELPLALEAFWDRFPLGVLHDRWVSLRESLDITEFVTWPKSPTPGISLFLAYDRTLPGMVGLAQVVPVGLGLLIAGRRKLRLVSTTLIGLGVILAMWGVWPRALGADTLQPLAPLIAATAAIGYLTYPQMRWLLGLAAVESFLVVSLTVLVGEGDAWQDTATTASYAVALILLVLAGWQVLTALPESKVLSEEPLDDRIRLDPTSY